jgi:hypothetical protein
MLSPHAHVLCNLVTGAGIKERYPITNDDDAIVHRMMRAIARHLFDAPSGTVVEFVVGAHAVRVWRAQDGFVCWFGPLTEAGWPRHGVRHAARAGFDVWVERACHLLVRHWRPAPRDGMLY